MSSYQKNKIKHGLASTTKLPPLGKSEPQVKIEAKKTTSGSTAPSRQLTQRTKVHNSLNLSLKQTKPYISKNSLIEEKNKGEISISGSPLAKSEEHSQHQPQLAAQSKPIEKRRMKVSNKMSLVCELKLKTLRREHNLLKQTIPPTDDVVEILREKAALEAGLVLSLKKKPITTRWDVIIDYVQENPQPGIFGLWEYIMVRGHEQLQERLQETFNIFVNNHFDRDLQNLQLNKDRQNRVAKVMLDNMQKADSYIDSLNLSIWEYQRYTEKMSNLVKDNDKSEDIDMGNVASNSNEKHSPTNIHMVYSKLESYVSCLEHENIENADEIETLKIKLYETNGEIERILHEAKRIRVDNQDKAKQIKTLQQEKHVIGKELEATQKKMNEMVNDKQSVNNKLDEMMNIMVQGMETLKVELKNDVKQEVSDVKTSVNSNINEMESRMTARLDDVQETVDELNEGQKDIMDGMSKMELKMETAAHSRKGKDKKVNLNINIKTPGMHDDGNDDDLIKTRSDKLMKIQRK